MAAYVHKTYEAKPDTGVEEEKEDRAQAPSNPEPLTILSLLYTRLDIPDTEHPLFRAGTAIHVALFPLTLAFAILEWMMECRELGPSLLYVVGVRGCVCVCTHACSLSQRHFFEVTSHPSAFPTITSGRAYMG